LFFMYLTPRFMEYARQYLKQDISGEAIEEAKRLVQDRIRFRTEVVSCPACGANVEMPLGTREGSVAIPRCHACGMSFTIRRAPSGIPFVSAYVGRQFICPRCHAPITDFQPTDEIVPVRNKKCYHCRADLLFDWNTFQATLIGDAVVIPGVQVSPTAI